MPSAKMKNIRSVTDFKTNLDRYAQPIIPKSRQRNVVITHACTIGKPIRRNKEWSNP